MDPIQTSISHDSHSSPVVKPGSRNSSALNLLQAPSRSRIVNSEAISQSNLADVIALAKTIFPEKYDHEHFTEVFRAFSENRAPQGMDLDGYKLHNYQAHYDQHQELVAFTGIYSHPSEPEKAGVGWFGIKTDRQGQGLGSYLLNKTESDARSLGFKKLEVSASVKPVATRNFYEKHGFKFICEIPFGDLTLPLLEKKLV